MRDPRDLLQETAARAADRGPADVDLPDVRRRAQRFERRGRTATAGAVLLPLLALLVVAPLLSGPPAAQRLDGHPPPSVAATAPHAAASAPAKAGVPESVSSPAPDAPAPASPAPQTPAPASSDPVVSAPGTSVPAAPASPDPVPAPPVAPEPPRVWLEAEAGSLTDPMLVHADADSTYVMVEDGLTDGPVTGDQGWVDLDVTVPQAATYVIWARVRAPDHGSNSFLVSVDGDEAEYWWIPPDSPDWRWLTVTERGPLTTKPYALSAGTHRLRFANREDGVALDRVLVTAVADDDPAAP